MLKSHIDQYIHAKVNKLHDRTDFFSSYYALCSFVTLRDDCESQLAAFNIRKVIPELEGQNVKYIGKSLSLAWPSLQVGFLQLKLNIQLHGLHIIFRSN